MIKLVRGERQRRVDGRMIRYPAGLVDARDQLAELKEWAQSGHPNARGYGDHARDLEVLLKCEARKTHYARLAKRRARELRMVPRLAIYREVLWYATQVLAEPSLGMALAMCASVGPLTFDRWRAAMAPAWWYPLQDRIARHLERLYEGRTTNPDLTSLDIQALRDVLEVQDRGLDFYHPCHDIGLGSRLNKLARRKLLTFEIGGGCESCNSENANGFALTDAGREVLRGLGDEA